MQWEYQVFKEEFEGTENLEDNLNKVGGDGWELVNIVVSPDLSAKPGDQPGYLIVFKRPKGGA